MEGAKNLQRGTAIEKEAFKDSDKKKNVLETATKTLSFRKI